MNWKKMLTTGLAAVCLAAGSIASAASSELTEFRSAYLPTASAERNYHVDMMLNGPMFRANAVTVWNLQPTNQAAMRGTLSWSYTDSKANKTLQAEMPIYGEGDDNALTLYGKRGAVWQKENILGGITWLVRDLIYSDAALKEKIAGAVKNVKTADAGTKNRRMELTMDGKALAGIETELGAQRLANLPEANKAAAEASIRYINQALSATNPEVVWCVNKETGKTVTVAADLTDFMRNYAKAVLQDSYDGKITLTNEEKEFLASIGYYYTLQFYLSDLDKVNEKAIVPGDVKQSAGNNGFWGDIKNELVSIVK